MEVKKLCNGVRTFKRSLDYCTGLYVFMSSNPLFISRRSWMLIINHVLTGASVGLSNHSNCNIFRVILLRMFFTHFDSSVVLHPGSPFLAPQTPLTVSAIILPWTLIARSVSPTWEQNQGLNYLLFNTWLTGACLIGAQVSAMYVQGLIYPVYKLLNRIQVVWAYKSSSKSKSDHHAEVSLNVFIRLIFTSYFIPTIRRRTRSRCVFYSFISRPSPQLICN